MLGDNLHPNAKGVTVIAEALAPLVEQALPDGGSQLSFLSRSPRACRRAVLSSDTPKEGRCLDKPVQTEKASCLNRRRPEQYDRRAAQAHRGADQVPAVGFTPSTAHSHSSAATM